MPRPDRESFHLGRARDAYVKGRIDLDAFEALAEHVLRGGHLSEHLEPKSSHEQTAAATKPAWPSPR